MGIGSSLKKKKAAEGATTTHAAAAATKPTEEVAKPQQPVVVAPVAVAAVVEEKPKQQTPEPTATTTTTTAVGLPNGPALPTKGGKYRVAINGFGRIGRILLRQMILRTAKLLDTEFEIVAINDPFLTPDNMAYIFTHDTVHGRFPGDVSFEGTAALIVSYQGQVHRFPTLCLKDPMQANWGALGVHWVLETSGTFTSLEKAQVHLKAGAGKVLITAPAEGTPVFVYGVNHTTYNNSNDSRVISNASCTTNCLAPLCDVVHKNFGIVKGLMTTVHSTTATQKTVDGPSGKAWRDGRAAAGNIIPSSTGAAKVIGKIIPELNGKLTGMSFRVPTLDVSVVDLTVQLAKPATYEEIMVALREASKSEQYKGVLETTSDDVVSTDFIGSTASTVVDEKAGIALDSTFVKLIAWYDNEWGYSSRVLDMLLYAMHQDLSASQK